MFFNRRIPLFIRESYYYDSKAAILWGIFWGLSLAFFPVIARKIGASSFQIALLTSAPFLGSLFTLYWSRLSNKRSKMKFFLRVKILARAAIFLMVLAINPWIFIAVVFLNALFEQAGSPAYTGIMKEIYPDSLRARAMGYVASEHALSAIFACYIGGFLLDRMSYRYIFPLAALIGIYSLAHFRKIKTQTKNKTRNSKPQGFLPSEAINVFRKDRSFFYYSLIFFIFGFGCLLAMPLFYAISFNLWFIILASSISGFIIGSELVRISYIAKITKDEDVQIYQGIDFSLMGIRGATAPFLGVGLMNLVGIRIALLISFMVTLAAFFLMQWFRTHSSLFLNRRLKEVS